MIFSYGNSNQLDIIPTFISKKVLLDVILGPKVTSSFRETKMSIGQNPITKLPQKYCSDKLEVKNSEQVSKKV